MLKKILARIGLVLAALFLVAQFIRPEKNIGDPQSPTDIAALYPVPTDVNALLRTSCYDCHSNATRYPWYAEIQPVGWWLNQHITEGKRHLNFSEFGKPNLRWQYRKLEKIAEEVEERAMPLPSYLIAHVDARLSDAQRERLIVWTKDVRRHLEEQHPEERFERER